MHTLPDGRVRIVCKGAPEALLTSSGLATDAATIAAPRDRADELARDGYRVLAVAAADRPTGRRPARARTRSASCSA